MGAARASDQKRLAFQSGPCYILAVYVACHLAYQSLSFPFSKVGIIILTTSFCEEHGKFLNLSGLLVNIISLPSLLAHFHVEYIPP